MKMTELPWSETIVAIIAAVIGWITGGRTQKESLEIQNSKAILDMWKETSETQRNEINELKNQIRSMSERMGELEKHIQTLEFENKKLKIQLVKYNQD